MPLNYSGISAVDCLQKHWEVWIWKDKIWLKKNPSMWIHKPFSHLEILDFLLSHMKLQKNQKKVFKIVIPPNCLWVDETALFRQKTSLRLSFSRINEQTQLPTFPKKRQKYERSWGLNLIFPSFKSSSTGREAGSSPSTKKTAKNYSGCFRFYISPCLCPINFSPTKDFCFQNPGYLSHFQKNPINYDIQHHQGIIPRNSTELNLPPPQKKKKTKKKHQKRAFRKTYTALLFNF